jgi:hypothetical protein
MVENPGDHPPNVRDSVAFINEDLAGAVPTVATWSLSGIPKGLSRDDVTRVLVGCNLRTPIGRSLRM